MDYEYLHSVVQGSYVTLPTERPLPSALEQSVNQYCYSSFPENSLVDESYVLFSLQPSGMQPVWVHSRTANKKKAPYPCKFIQCGVWEMTEGLAEAGPENVLDMGFYSEDEVDAYAKGEKTAAFGSGSVKACPKRINFPIAHKAVESVLFGICQRLLMGEAMVKIGVPEEYMDCYSAYAVSAMRRLYAYMPTSMRLEAGFSTFLAPGAERQMKRVAVQFVPASKFDARTILLDGSSTNVYAKYCISTGMKGLNVFLKYLASKTPEEHKELFREIFLNDEKQNPVGFDVTRYAKIGNALDAMSEQNATVEYWNTVLNRQENYSPYLMNQILQKIQREMTSDKLVDYLKKTNAQTTEEACRNASELLPLSRVVNCTGSLWKYVCGVAEKLPVVDQLTAMKKNEAALVEMSGKAEYKNKINELNNQVCNEIYDAAKKEADALTTKDPEKLKEQLKIICNQAVEKAKEYQDSATSEKFREKLSAQLEEQLANGLKNALNQIPKEANTDQKFRDICAELDMLSKLAENGGSQALKDAASQIKSVKATVESNFNSSVAIYREVTQKISKASYFQSLSEINRRRKELAEEKWKQLIDEQAAKKPRNRDDYLKSFYEYAGEPLSAAALGSSKGILVRDQVTANLKTSVNVVRVEDMKQGESLESFVARIGAEGDALCGPDAKLQVNFGSTCVSVRELNRCLSAGDLAQRVQAMENCGIPNQTCLRWVKEGCLKGSSKEEYKAYFMVLKKKGQQLPQRGECGELADAALEMMEPKQKKKPEEAVEEDWRSAAQQPKKSNLHLPYLLTAISSCLLLIALLVMLFLQTQPSVGRIVYPAQAVLQSEPSQQNEQTAVSPSETEESQPVSENMGDGH